MMVSLVTKAYSLLKDDHAFSSMASLFTKWLLWHAYPYFHEATRGQRMIFHLGGILIEREASILIPYSL